MLQYLIIQLDDTSTSFCHYMSRKTSANLISLDVLKNGIKFAMKENLMIQFLYPDYILPHEYKEAISCIDHSDIVASTCEDLKLVEAADVVVLSDCLALDYFKFKKDSIYVLRISKDDLFERYNFLKRALSDSYRFNIILTDVEKFKQKDFDKYGNILNSLSGEVENIFSNGESIQLNVLTDRLVLSEMNNCDAGEKHITLAPNGNFYPCPAFYNDFVVNSDSKYPDYDYCIGNLSTGLEIKNQQLYRLDHSPLCRTCDAYHCKRCIWLNKRLTLEVNTPSHEQCVLAHIERNHSRALLGKLKPILPALERQEIKEVKYLDPFEHRKEW